MLYFVRHGQTDSNAKQVFVDKLEPLNSTGIDEALKTAQNLKDVHFDVLFCSPLTRAKQTAEIVNRHHNLPIVIDNSLTERDWGKYMHMLVESVDRKASWNFFCSVEGIEPIKDAFKRVYSFLNYLKENFKDKNVLVVSHSGVGRITNCYFTGIPENGDLLSKGLKNG